MAPPKLKMTEQGVTTAIERMFRKNFQNLKYVPKTDIVSIDGNVLVQLKREFDGSGEYPITIEPKLFIPISMA